MNPGASCTAGRGAEDGVHGSLTELLLYSSHQLQRSNTAAALNHAVYMNADIINMSLSPPNEYCSNDSYDGIRAAVQAAENAGVLVVVSAGNDGNLGGHCRVSSYGAFPDTLTVGGIEDVTDLSSMSTVAVASFTGSNTSTQTTTIAGGTSASTRMVDLTTTAHVDFVAGDGTTGISSNVGTSFSAPQVAGAAAVLKHWAYSQGGSMSAIRNNPYVLRVMLAAMGDGAGPGASGGGTGQLWLLDHLQGFGHLRFTVPSFIGNTAYAHWAIRAPALQQGDVYEYPIGYSSGAEPSQLLGWKFVALMDYDWYDAPDVSFELIDKCPAGGGETLVLWANKTTHKARMRMRGSSDMSTKYHSRCLWIRATVHHSNGVFGLYMMDYSYTNSRTYHDM